MCGCTGKYSYTERGAKEHSPGYQPNVNERSVKIIANKVLRSSNKKVEGDCVFVEQNGRVLVAWFD
jgi:hypothetical protein